SGVYWSAAGRGGGAAGSCNRLAPGTGWWSSGGRTERAGRRGSVSARRADGAGSFGEDDACAARGREGEGPTHDAHPAAGEPKLGAREHHGQHDFHLIERERHPQAAPDAAAEREPSVRVHLPAEEPLRPEARRLRVDVGAAVDAVDEGRDSRPRTRRDADRRSTEPGSARWLSSTRMDALDEREGRRRPRDDVDVDV